MSQTEEEGIDGRKSMVARVAADTVTATSVLDYNVVTKSGKKRLLLCGELSSSKEAAGISNSSAKLKVLDVSTAEKVELELPITCIQQMLRNGNSNISLRYDINPNRKICRGRLDCAFISKEDCSEFAVSLALLLPALKLGNEFFRIDDEGKLIYEVHTNSKKGKKHRTLILDPTKGTLSRLAVSVIKDSTSLWDESGVHLTIVPEHENRRLHYTYPGGRLCDVEFPSAAIRSDFVSNVRKIIHRLPLDVEFSMGEFKALQSVLVHVLEEFRKKLPDPAQLRIDRMRFHGEDIQNALISTDVYQVICDRFPREVGGHHDKERAIDIATKFLQYGMMKDTAGSSTSKGGNSKTRLQFRMMGKYRFSKSGFGTVFDVCCATWNVGEKKPPSPEDLRLMLRPGAEIYAIGLQECNHREKWVSALQVAVGSAGVDGEEVSNSKDKRKSFRSQNSHSHPDDVA